MSERRVPIGWPQGLHARPAAVFVRAAAASGVPLTVARPGGEPVDARSLLRVLGLAAMGGEEVVLATALDGPEAEEALDRLARMVQDGLDALPDAVGPQGA